MSHTLDDTANVDAGEPDARTTMLVIGGSGKTGRRVSERLTRAGHAVRSVSRSSTPAFDWEDPTGWAAALEGCHSAYVTYSPDLAVPAAEEAIATLIRLAREAGLQHLVLLSGRGEAGAQRAEQQLMHSGLDWNVVRASWFMQNFSEGFMVEGILEGELKLPADAIPEPFVDVDDIAEVAVAALTRRELRNRLFEVTGPRAMTFADCTAEIAAVMDHPVRFTPLDIEVFIDELSSQGLPQDMLWLMRELFTVVLDGRNASPVSGVEEALGRPATDFRDYVRKAAEEGAWQRSALLQHA